jgi:hypothetical protein
LDYPQERDVFYEIPKDVCKTPQNVKHAAHAKFRPFLLHCCEFNARVIKEWRNALKFEWELTKNNSDLHQCSFQRLHFGAR